ncbi:hypothetical protein RRG08_018730 [Elysia crispata]|uniref:Uncharacterized protein n=1 Tax=Elysia crispata TaxID=231223 RepID=A0AAE0Y909_9GAST|nr:hypothetical protein RRG08_018730 [Elysia crispata]
MTCWRLTASLALLTLGLAADGQFVNFWWEDANFNCPKDQMLSSIYSIFNLNKDRSWDFGCTPFPYGDQLGDCSWSVDYANDWTEYSEYQCPLHTVLAGVHSTASIEHRDRRMKFKCCKFSKNILTRCQWSNVLNKFKGLLFFSLPSDTLPAGMKSDFDEHEKDRIFKMFICSYSKL